jgi:hypothetical protein
VTGREALRPSGHACAQQVVPTASRPPRGKLSFAFARSEPLSLTGERAMALTTGQTSTHSFRCNWLRLGRRWRLRRRRRPLPPPPALDIRTQSSTRCALESALVEETLARSSRMHNGNRGRRRERRRSPDPGALGPSPRLAPPKPFGWFGCWLFRERAREPSVGRIPQDMRLYRACRSARLSIRFRSVRTSSQSHTHTHTYAHLLCACCWAGRRDTRARVTQFGLLLRPSGEQFLPFSCAPLSSDGR